MLVGGLMIAFQDVTLFIPLFKKKSSLKLFGDGFFQQVVNNSVLGLTAVFERMT
jgi:hypothetical protein